jgi:formylglycine-generating enzyme required for sulfatase activity
MVMRIACLVAVTACWSAAPPTPPVAPREPPPKRVAHCPDSMVLVPKSTFTMGQPSPDPYSLEAPAHSVSLDAYCIDRTEVTVAAYEECVAESRCEPAPRTVDHLPGNPRYPDPGLCNGGKPHLGEHPINCVTWYHADAYCKSLDKRLPTEAEWELAARGRDGRTFPWGNEAPKRDDAVQRLNWAAMSYTLGKSATTRVGQFPTGASPYGALDMAGNVEEWLGDWLVYYPDHAETNPTGGTMEFGPWAERFRERFGVLPTKDPSGKRPAIGVGRATRGGEMGFTDVKQYFTYERGTGLHPDWRDYGLGFRCATPLR